MNHQILVKKMKKRLKKKLKKKIQKQRIEALMDIAKKIEVFIENTIIDFNKPDEDDIETTIGDTTIRIKK